MWNKLSLSAKLSLVSTLVVALCLAVGITLQSMQASDITRRLTIEKAQELGSFHAEQISKRLDGAMKVAEMIGVAFKGLREGAGVKDRHVYDAILKETLDQNPNLAGAWAGYEPNALDGKDADYKNDNSPLNDPETGRYATYYFNYGDGVVGSALTGLAKTETSNSEDLDYYNIPKREKRPTVVDPVFYKDLGDGGVLLPSFVVPILNKTGKFLGVAGVDIMTNLLAEEFGALHPFETGSVYLISYKGKWVAHENKDFLGKNIPEQKNIAAIFKDAVSRIQKGESWTQDDGDFVRVFIPVQVPRTNTPWSVVVNIPKAKIVEDANFLRNMTIAGGVVAILIIVGALTFVSIVLIRRPLTQSIGVINALQDGNYQIDIPGQERGDEIGQVNQALETFKQNAQKVRDMELEQEAAKIRTEEERKQARRQLADDFESSVGEIVASVSNSSNQMAGAADQMNQMADRSQEQAVTVAGAAEEASVNVQTVAASTEELTASINEISQQVAKSAQIASGAVEEADRSNKMVRALAEAADKIGEVVSLINDIAEQTNLLALNATIEAARAGEAGKGFAVVANEVKSLANQTGKATDEIVQQINAIQTETRGTVDAIESIGQTIGSIHSIATAIAAAVEEQEAATREISSSVQQAAAGTNEVSSNVTGMKDTATQTGESASEVQESATALADQARNLDDAVKNFVEKIRTE